MFLREKQVYVLQPCLKHLVLNEPTLETSQSIYTGVLGEVYGSSHKISATASNSITLFLL